jgi:peptidoglycan hydrolase CwlO-like protein
MKVEGNLTIGNILTMLAMAAAIGIFIISMSFNAQANRDDIVELKQSMNTSVSELKASIKEIQQSIKEMQTTINGIDKRLIIIEERMGRPSAAGLSSLGG